jgi:NTE family protein
MRPMSLVVLLSLLAVTGGGCCSVGGRCPKAATTVIATQRPATCPTPDAPQRPYPFINLVFEGGGVRGIAYGGALEVLDQAGILGQVKGVAGTSAGAITATLVALGYTPSEIQQLLMQLDFTKFEDGGCSGLLRLFRRYGWYCGDYVLNLMQCLVERKTGSRHTTFAEMQKAGLRELRVFATDLNSTQIVEYSRHCSPTMEVATAVRMSMSIPLFFASIQQAGSVHVDGGVLLNYPIDTFDDFGNQAGPERTLGMILVDTASTVPGKPINGLPQYMKQLFAAILDTENVDIESDPFELRRTISINDLGISSTDFALSRQQELDLINQGIADTCNYLTRWRPVNDLASSPAPGVMRKRFQALSRGRCATGAN